MWLLPRQTLLSRDCGWRSRKAVTASTDSSVSRLLVTISVSTSGIWVSRCSTWSMSASTSEQPIIRTVFTSSNSRNDRRQQPKLVFEASPPISSTMWSVRAVLLLSSSTDSTTFLLPSDLRQTLDCLLTSRGMQVSKEKRCSSSRATSARSCSSKRVTIDCPSSIDLMMDREIRDLLKPFSRLNLELLVLLARFLLLDVPQILDLSSLETLEQLLDWMFSLSSRCFGDFLMDFSRSFPSSFPSSRPFSATILLVSYPFSCYITPLASAMRLASLSAVGLNTSPQSSSILRKVVCKFSLILSISRISAVILSSQYSEILLLRSSMTACRSLLAVGRSSASGCALGGDGDADVEEQEAVELEGVGVEEGVGEVVDALGAGLESVPLEVGEVESALEVSGAEAALELVRVRIVDLVHLFSQDYYYIYQITRTPCSPPESYFSCDSDWRSQTPAMRIK